MKVVLSARVAAEIASQLEYGLEHFGSAVAERTFARLDAFLFQFLPDYPYAGKYLEAHGIYETWVSKTPFVTFYRVDAQSDTITVLALFHHAQDRAAFDPED
jgi:plasmid stabilization system protein ParE